MVDVIDENAVNVYTDGSCYPGPRRGGIGVLFVVVDDMGEEVVFEERPLGYRSATNQQMELQACIEALKILAGSRSPVDPTAYQKVIIKTDSMYVVENIRNAQFSWPKSKWHTRNGTPVANTAQWKELVKRADSLPRRVHFRWVKGHKESTYNRRADKLAKDSAKGGLQGPLTVTSVRRKKSAKTTERGSVKLSGQMLTIFIITDEYLRTQRCYKYKYEVLSKASPFFGNVDLAFSTILLRAGHTYYVRFNDDDRNPRVLKMFKEITSTTTSK
jgi:ribonuclease HI